MLDQVLCKYNSRHIFLGTSQDFSPWPSIYFLIIFWLIRGIVVKQIIAWRRCLIILSKLWAVLMWQYHMSIWVVLIIFTYFSSTRKSGSHNRILSISVFLGHRSLISSGCCPRLSTLKISLDDHSTETLMLSFFSLD